MVRGGKNLHFEWESDMEVVNYEPVRRAGDWEAQPEPARKILLRITFWASCGWTAHNNYTRVRARNLRAYLGKAARSWPLRDWHYRKSLWLVVSVGAKGAIEGIGAVQSCHQ